MDDTETRLRKAPLDDPSPELDRALERMFLDAGHRSGGLLRRPVALWQTAAACAASLAFGFLIHAYVEREPGQPKEIVRTVYYVPTTSEMQKAFNFETEKPSIPKSADSYRVRIEPADLGALGTGKGVS